MSRIKLILDTQFGSTGKGLIAGHLALRDNPDTLMTAWAANAGHTFIDRFDRKFVHTMVPNGVVSANLRRILIGPGSLINPKALRAELDALPPGMLKNVDVLIHPNAAVITREHQDLEAGPMTKIGSTKKGVGEAAIARIRRDPTNMNTALMRDYREIGETLLPHPDLESAGLGMMVAGSIEEFNNAVDASRRIQIEGAQGYSLSMYHGFYPYTTSRDVSTAQTLADVGLPWAMTRETTVIGCARTYPIRVANRYDEEGNQVGWSGPCYDDQGEISFADLGLEPELTTVTKLPRRIFTFSHEQMDAAIRQCGVEELFLNFVNYLNTPEEVQTLVEAIEDYSGECFVRYLGTGPSDHDVIDLGDPDGDRFTLEVQGQIIRAQQRRIQAIAA